MRNIGDLLAYIKKCPYLSEKLNVVKEMYVRDLLNNYTLTVLLDIIDIFLYGNETDTKPVKKKVVDIDIEFL